MKNYWTRVTPSIEYAVSDRVALRAELPFHMNHRKQGNQNVSYEGRGFGDVTISGRYWLNDPSPDRWSFYLEAALGIPTGDDDQYLGSGAPKRPYIIPGSGTWNPSLGLGVTKTFGDLTVFGAARYTYTIGENDTGYDAGEPFSVSAGIAQSVFKWGPESEKILGFSLNGSYVYVNERDKRDGDTVRNSGGNWVHVTPGLFFSPDNGKFTAFVAFPILAYFNVKNLQTAERYAMTFGINYRFR